MRQSYDVGLDLEVCVIIELSCEVSINEERGLGSELNDPSFNFGILLALTNTAELRISKLLTSNFRIQVP